MKLINGPTPAELSIGLAGLEGAAAPAPKAEAPAAPIAEARWLGSKPRSKTVDLEHPFELGGLEFRTITLKRLQVGGIDAFLARVREAGKGLRFPMFFAYGRELTDAEWAALDADDRDALVAAADDFLPARFKDQAAGPAA